MKQLLTTITMLLALCIQVSAQEQAQMEFKNDFKETSSDLGVNLTATWLAGDDWVDRDGNAAATIRISVENMSMSEKKKLKVAGSSNIAIGKTVFDEKKQQWYVAVAAAGNMYLELTHEAYGKSSRLNITKPLKANTIYDVTLVNNKTTTIVVNSNPEGATVYLDGDKKGITPCQIQGQRLGQHELKLVYNGASVVRNIEVDEGNAVFDKFDFRERTKVKITSDPDGAAIYVDGEMIGKAPILDYDMVLGAHTFKAVLNAEQYDESPINITRYTTTVALHPVKKGNVVITTKYAGRPASANLVVDNENNYNNEETYNLTLPYGTHTFRVYYMGKQKEKTINIHKPEMSHVFKLSAKNDFLWPWQREYNDRPAGFSMGYVSKQLVSKNGSERAKLDPAYFREGKWLSGIQIGLHFQPTFSWGGGLYTGIFYELYFTKSNNYGGEPIDDAYSHFTEHSLNIPLHLYYRLPFSRNFSIALHGGVGMDIGIYAFYAGSFMGMGDKSNSEVLSDYYGEDNFGPKRVNFTADLGLSLNIGPVAINGFYSKGLTNHKGIIDWEGEEGSTHINKFGVSLSWLIGGDK